MTYVSLSNPKPTSGFSVFNVDALIDNSITDFDLFVDVANHFILYSGNGYKWEKAELEHLIKVGYTKLWIHPSQLKLVEVYRNMSMLPEISQQLKPSERILAIQSIGATFTKYLYEGELTDSCIRAAEKIVDKLVDCILENPACVKELSGLANHDMYTYLHSIRVSAYATAIAVRLGITDRQHLKQIAMGGIFHDVGKTEVPLEILHKRGPLLDSEWTIMRSHPTVGHEKIKDKIQDQVTREIIIHHHERMNGSGYPHGLDKGSLIIEVQIAAVADIFDALTSTRSYQNKRTRFEGLDFIKNRLLHTEVSAEAFKGLIASLAT